MSTRRNKTKKTLRGRTIIKKLKDNTVLLPGGARYKVGERICFSGKGITPIKRKGKVGKVGYSIEDVPDLIYWKPEVGEVGGVGVEVGGVGHYMYKSDPAWKWEVTPEPPSAWASWSKLLAGYARELRDALVWFFSLSLRFLPDVATPAAPVPLRDVPPLDSFRPAPETEGPAPAGELSAPLASPLAEDPAPATAAPELAPAAKRKRTRRKGRK